jgi:hypothetical protein
VIGLKGCISIRRRRRRSWKESCLNVEGRPTAKEEEEERGFSGKL